MKSRMEKYYDNHELTKSRLDKNDNLYKEINNMNLEKFNPNSNVKVIGDNENVIDVDKIRNLLETNYKTNPKRKSIKIDDYEYEEINLEETKEYDINSILEKAREEKEVDYERDRLKKLRDTQFDILNNLDLDEVRRKVNEEDNPAKSAKEEELMSLINTITSKELAKTCSVDPLDILSDLKGDDNTKVLSGIEEEVKKGETRELMQQEKNDKLTNSFYTTTNAFTKSDFDDFNDLKDDLKSTKIIIRVLIVLIVIAFIGGVLFFLNNYLNLQIF